MPDVLMKEPVAYELTDIGDGIMVPLPRKRRKSLNDLALEVCLVASWLFLGGSVVYAVFIVLNWFESII